MLVMVKLIVKSKEISMFTEAVKTGVYVWVCVCVCVCECVCESVYLALPVNSLQSQ